MPTVEEYAKQPVAERLRRLGRTPDDLVAAIRGKSEEVLARRPDAKNWAAKEVVSSKLLPANPDRWAEERQYLRNDAAAALAAFRRRREESLAYLGKLTPEGWRRAGVHPQRGRMTIEDFVTLVAWHDDNHLDQLKRALEGRA